MQEERHDGCHHDCRQLETAELVSTLPRPTWWQSTAAKQLRDEIIVGKEEEEEEEKKFAKSKRVSEAMMT